MNEGFSLTQEELKILTCSLKKYLENEQDNFCEVEDLDRAEATAQNILNCIKLLKKLEGTQNKIEESHDEETSEEVAA